MRDQNVDKLDVVLVEGEEVRFKVKVSPGASGTKVLGGYGDMVKIALNVPAEKGRANKLLVGFLAKLIGVPRSSVRIVSGEKSQRKVVGVRGVSCSVIKKIFFSS